MSQASPGSRFGRQGVEARIAAGAPGDDNDSEQDPIDLTASQVRNPTERLTGASANVRDTPDAMKPDISPLPLDDHYRLLFEGNPIPMWVFDRGTLRFIAVNEAAIRQYGFTRQEFLAKTILEIRPEEDVADVLTDIAHRPPGLQERGFWRHRRKNGELIDVEVVCYPLDFQGIESMLVSAYDITARKRAEEATRRAEEKYRGMFEDAVIGIFQATVDGRLVSANRAFAQMHGFDSPEEMLAELEGKTMGLAVDPGKMAEYAQIVAEDGALRGVEMEVYTKDRSRKWLRLSIRKVRDASNNVVLHEGTTEDIAEQKGAEEALENSKNRYHVLFDDSGDANWLMDESGVLDCNAAARQMFGYSVDEPMPQPYDMSPPHQSDGEPSLAAAKQKIVSVLVNGKERFEWLHQRKNGEVFPAEVCLTRLTLSGRPVLLATVRDITERKRAEEALLFKTALLEAQSETTIEGILAIDDSDHIILANKQFKIGFDIPDELLTRQDDVALREHVMDKIQGPEAFVEKIKYLNSHRNEKSSDEIRLKNGKIFDRYSAPLVDATGRYRGRIWYHRDVTERKAAEERIQFLAYYDALTELPHRALLQDRMEVALADARRRGEKIAVMFLDLDGFKEINDSFGHSFGDVFLKEVAKRIQDCGRERDTVARVGGDEFVVLQSSAKEAADAAIAAERIMTALSEPFVIQGQSLNASCSVGVSMFPEHGTDSEVLIRNADAAMYCAKSDGRGKIRFFTNEMNVEAQERLTMDKNLRLALDREEFFLVYQPQVKIETGRIIGLEALIRWPHPKLGLIPPDRFIPIAENNGMIVPIGEWVLRTACAQARKWQDDGLAAVPVAVNVSAVQFRQEGFPALIRKVLMETGLSAGCLELELTESLLLSDVDVVFATLRELKKMGLQLAIDDFGTGYSSLSYLKRFPVDKLKIDRSFVRDIAVDSEDAAITTAIISMARNLRLNVIAEGVETEEQMSFLRDHGCDEIQGYYFSKPLSADDATSMLNGQIRLAHRDSAEEPGAHPFPSADSFRRLPVSA